MNIVYLHGKESSPNSNKRKLLESLGHKVSAPFLDKNNWEQSVSSAREAINTIKPDVIVASSRGAAVAMATNTPVPLVLIAPAWAKYCPWSTCRANTVILHSKTDKVIPYKESVKLSHAAGAELIEIGSNHRMNSKEVYETLSEIIENKAKSQ
mgnify:CR=1 FL=1